MLNYPILDSARDFNDFLKNYGWIFAVAVAALILIVVVLIILLGRKKKGGRKAVVDETAYYAALGGADNIVSHELVGSRIKLQLKDYDLLDKEKIKEAGVDGFIMMSDRLTLVIKGDAKAVYEKLFGVNA
ncbi:MAG: PTS transporter subunit EIIB [Bacilli bacterium]|nr:PTS transporter subunit EIIB [Bacilli bacterium]